MGTTTFSSLWGIKLGEEKTLILFPADFLINEINGNAHSTFTVLMFSTVYKKPLLSELLSSININVHQLKKRNLSCKILPNSALDLFIYNILYVLVWSLLDQILSEFHVITMKVTLFYSYDNVELWSQPIPNDTKHKRELFYLEL